MSGIDKSTETDSGLVFARACGMGDMGNDYLMRMGFPFEVMKVFWN